MWEFINLMFCMLMHYCLLEMEIWLFFMNLILCVWLIWFVWFEWLFHAQVFWLFVFYQGNWSLNNRANWYESNVLKLFLTKVLRVEYQIDQLYRFLSLNYKFSLVDFMLGMRFSCFLWIWYVVRWLFWLAWLK